jgi:hypothetical protein
VTTINQRSGRSDVSLFLKVCTTLAIFAWVVTSVHADDATRTVRLLRPLSGATVREEIPVRIAPADLPRDGYFTVSIDKVFRTAEVINPGNSLLYVWDSQAPFQEPNDPGVDKYTEDGDHEIEVSVYDRQGNLLATGAATVKLANKVTNLPDGIKLSYAWTEDQTLRYKRHSELNMLSTGGDTSSQNVETTDVRFSRSIEDSTGGEYLVRDQVYPDGLIVNHAGSNLVQNVFDIKSRYRTVNSYGETLVEETPFSAGDHIGFSIVQVPARRITVGDSWDTKIEVSVPWASEKPTVLDGSARLDCFEWQDGYPTAKVIETYDGPATLFADTKATISFQADNVHLVRTYWFAYNSKRLVKSRTDMTIDSDVTPDIAAAFTATAGATQQQAPIMNPFGGADNNGQSPALDNGEAAAAATTPIKLEVTDDVTLVGI